MKNIFFLLLMAAFCSGEADAQSCNYKGVQRKLRRYCVSETKPKPDVATKLYLLFDRLHFAGSSGFAKSGKDYYYYLHLARNLSKNFEIRSTNALTLTLSSGKEITMFPAGDYSGKRMLNWFAIGCYYKLSAEDLQALAAEKVQRIQLQIFSEAAISGAFNGAEGWHTDAAGNISFTHTIEAEEKKEKCRRAANCLLAKGG